MMVDVANDVMTMTHENMVVGLEITCQPDLAEVMTTSGLVAATMIYVLDCKSKSGAKSWL